MGYTTAFLGELTVDPPLTATEVELVEDCYDFDVDAEGTVIRIDVNDKPSATIFAIEDLVNVLARGEASEIFDDSAEHLTTPPTRHVINGTVEYFGGLVKVENSSVTAD